jgi:hypothetical protein
VLLQRLLFHRDSLNCASRETAPAHQGARLSSAQQLLPRLKLLKDS